MSLTKTPVCNFGEKAKDFILISTDSEKITLKDYKGKNGTLVMFICNHCPYVKAIIKELVDDIKFLEILGIKSIAVMSNDVVNYPEDSFTNMVSFAKKIIFLFHMFLIKLKKLLKIMEQYVHQIFLVIIKI